MNTARVRRLRVTKIVPMTRASPVVIQYPDGEILIVPAYTPRELQQIVAEGEQALEDMRRLGKMPNLTDTAYVPNTHEE